MKTEGWKATDATITYPLPSSSIGVRVECGVGLDPSLEPGTDNNLLNGLRKRKG